MPRPQKEPLPCLDARRTGPPGAAEPRADQPAARVARAKALLAVAAGHRFTTAAQAAGRRSGDAVAQLVARFNRQGLAALDAGHGGGQPKRYTSKEQARILREVRREPERDADGTATWSLSTLQRALRRAPDGLSNTN